MSSCQYKFCVNERFEFVPCINNAVSIPRFHTEHTHTHTTTYTYNSRFIVRSCLLFVFFFLVLCIQYTYTMLIQQTRKVIVL